LEKHGGGVTLAAVFHVPRKRKWEEENAGIKGEKSRIKGENAEKLRKEAQESATKHAKK
jgi:hypothetical protein